MESRQISDAQPLVSIVLTTLNGARYIGESIDSCLGQTIDNLELLVVDGGSEDGTIEIVESCEDPRVRLLPQTDNVGRLPGAINIGLNAARGRYVTWTQDDSKYEPSALEQLVQVLEERPDVAQVYTDWWVVADDGSRTYQRAAMPDELASMSSDRVGVCFLLRASARAEIGPHDVDTFPCQDYDFRLRLAQRFASAHLPAAPYSYRAHPHSLTGRLGWATLARKDVEIRRKLGMGGHWRGRLDLAGIDAACAFEAYEQGQLHGVLRPALAAFWRDPRLLANRGLWAITTRSFVRTIGDRFRADESKT